MFDCKGFYKLAKELSLVNDESHYRTSIGRAYYFIYNKANKYLKDNKLEKPNQSEKGKTLGSHQQTWFAFRYKVKDGKTIYKLGTQSHKSRKDADYEMDKAITKKNVITQLEIIDKINEKISNLNS